MEAMVKRTVPAWGRICKAQMVILDKSLNDVCTESGFSRSYVSGIMNGRIYGPPEAIEKISSTLNVDPKLYGVERRIVSGTDDGLFSDISSSSATQSDRRDIFYAA